MLLTGRPRVTTYFSLERIRLACWVTKARIQRHTYARARAHTHTHTHTNTHTHTHNV